MHLLPKVDSNVLLLSNSVYSINPYQGWELKDGHSMPFHVVTRQSTIEFCCLLLSIARLRRWVKHFSEFLEHRPSEEFEVV